MKNLFTTVSTLLLALMLSCTNQDEMALKGLSNEAIFTKVDQQPTFAGGMPAFYEYVNNNLQFPKDPKLAEVKGRVYVQFIITKDGRIEEATVIRGLEETFDKAALELVKNSPKWTPGSQKGVPVNVKMVLPISFSRKTNLDNVTEVLELEMLDDTMFNAEAMPEFNGGTKALFSYFQSNIKYPEKAKRAGISGKVLIEFVVKKDGSISNAKLVKGIDEECDLEAIRVIKEMPLWNPGMSEDKPLDVKMILPISFKLD